MSAKIGESSGVVVAGRNTLVEALRHRGEGPHVLSLKNEGDVSVLLRTERRRMQAQEDVATDQATIQKSLATPYDPDGATAAFTGSLIGTAGQGILPGSLTVLATADSPAVSDLDGDGVMWQTGNARKLGASGTFATMASESMVVKIDGGDEITVTFGTEATIGAAVAIIDAALSGVGSGEAQGAQNVDIVSDSLGEGSSVEVVSVDAGITTKLGISTGLADNQIGTVNYWTRALDITYEGYLPTDIAALLVDMVESVVVPAGTTQLYNVLNLQADDELVVSLVGQNDRAKCTVDIRPLKG